MSSRAYEPTVQTDISTAKSLLVCGLENDKSTADFCWSAGLENDNSTANQQQIPGPQINCKSWDLLLICGPELTVDL